MSRYKRRLPTLLADSLIVYPNDERSCAASGIVFDIPPSFAVVTLCIFEHFRLYEYLRNRGYRVGGIGDVDDIEHLVITRRKRAFRYARNGIIYVNFDTWTRIAQERTPDLLNLLKATGTWPEDPTRLFRSIPNDKEENLDWFRRNYPEVAYGKP